MIDWIYDLPLWQLAVVSAIVFVGFAWLGSIFLRPVLRLFVRADKSTNDIIGTLSATFGVLYGILLGLTAVAAYQNWGNVDTNVTKEAGSMLSLYQTVSTYPEPTNRELSRLLRELCQIEIGEEWAHLKKGKFGGGARPFVEMFQRGLVSFEPQTKSQEVVHADAIQTFNTWLSLKRLRLYSATQAGIPAILWYVVITGAIINIVFIWLLDMRFITQLFLGGLLAFFLGAMIILIARLDQPLRGDDGLSPIALTLVCQFMSKQKPVLPQATAPSGKE